MNIEQRNCLIRELYGRGVPRREIARQTGLAPGTISQLVSTSNNQTPPGTKVDNDERQLILDLYESGQSMSAVADEVGRAIRTVCRIVNQAQISRSYKTPNQYIVNSNFFANIDTEIKAYWLGFLMADGSVTSRKKVTYRAVRVNLSTKDKGHLERLNKSIGSTYPLKLSQINKATGVKAYRLVISNLEFTNYLLALDWDNFKKNGNWIKVQDGLERHQVRGFIDGDGWITRRKTSNPPVGIGVCSQFIEPLIETARILDINPTIRRTSSILAWQVSGSVCRRLHSILYDEATVWLPRKRARLEELLNQTRQMTPGQCWCGRASKANRRSCQQCISNAVERNRRRRS